jgi:hypothetical protein
MNLPRTLDAIKKETLRNRKLLRDASARIPVLARYESPETLLAALDLASPIVREERDALLEAITSEAQLSPRTFWSSLLLVAFAPMLLRLRARLGRAPDEDFDQTVLVAFVGAVKSVRPGHYTAIALRWATEKAVFAARRAEQRIPVCREFEEERYAPDVFGTVAEQRAAAAEVVRAVEAELGDEMLEALLTRRAGNDSLRAHVTRTHAGKSASARDAEYERLLRARVIVLRELRARFERSAA